MRNLGKNIVITFLAESINCSCRLSICLNHFDIKQQYKKGKKPHMEDEDNLSHISFMIQCDLFYFSQLNSRKKIV